jgi:arylsulfatase A-like enzyme
MAGRIRALLLGCAALVVLFGCRGPSHETVVLVSLDTLHVRATGPYNPAVATTPSLDWFAAHGVRFASAWSQASQTLPSHTSILSGLEPARHGALLNGDHVRDEVLTLPEILREHGFATAAFISLGVLRPAFGLDQGFDSYDAGGGSTAGRTFRSAGEVIAAVESWWANRPEGRIFLWVHLSDPHSPYLAPGSPPDTELRLDGDPVGRYLLAGRARHAPLLELAPGEHRLTWLPLRDALRLRLLEPERWSSLLAEGTTRPEEIELRAPYTLHLTNRGERSLRLRLPFRGRLEDPPRSAVRAAYAAEVAYADEHLGRLRALISPDGDLDGGLDGALWILVSDHGEGLFRHEVLAHAPYVFEDQLRALWILAGEGLPQGRTAEADGALLTDVAPTVLELLGLPVPGDLDGRSRVDCWSGAGCAGRSTWWAYGADVGRRRATGVAVYAPPLKCLWHLAPSSGCFRLAEDPWETRNLAATEAPAVRAILPEIERRRTALEAALAAGPAPAPEDLEMLRDLGYVD